MHDSMDTVSETVLSNLHVIGALRQNDKLNTTTDLFDVHVPTWSRALWRLCWGESRQQTVQRVRQAVRSGIAVCLALHEAERKRNAGGRAEGRTSSEGARDVTAGISREHVLRMQRFLRALQSAQTGIRHIMQTYHGDASTVVQLGLIAGEIQDCLVLVAPDAGTVSLRGDAWEGEDASALDRMHLLV